MKKRRKFFIFVAAIVFLTLGIIITTSLDLTPQKPDYTIFNHRDTGASLLYDTLNGMGFTVAPEYQKIGLRSSIYIIRMIIQPNYYYMSDEDDDAVLEYVYNGGRVIYLSSSSRTMAQTLVFLHNAALEKQKGEFFLFSYGLGQIFIGPPNVTNGELLNDRSAGYYISDVLKSWQDKDIFINEAYHGYAVEPNIWDAAPPYIKNLAYQTLIVVILVILYLGKRFGKPVKYYEEIEREENEYLIALANVYNKAGNGYIIYESSLETFLKKAARIFGLTYEHSDIKILAADLLKEWKKREMPYYDDFLEVMGYEEKDFKTKRSNGRRRLYRARLILERLEECL